VSSCRSREEGKERARTSEDERTEERKGSEVGEDVDDVLENLSDCRGRKREGD